MDMVLMPVSECSAFEKLRTAGNEIRLLLPPKPSSKTWMRITIKAVQQAAYGRQIRKRQASAASQQ